MPTFKAYQKFDPSDIINGRVNKISSGFFPGAVAYYTQSALVRSVAQSPITGSNGALDVLNGLYYSNITDNTTAAPTLFSVTYGDYYGGGTQSGSIFNQTKAIYSQYKNILLGTTDPTGMFSFRSGSISGSTYITSSHIYVINFASPLMKDQIDPGQFQFSLSGSLGVDTSFVDETAILPASQKQEQRLVYEIIPGNFVNGITSGSQTYIGVGLFYPKNGCIVLNADVLSSAYGINFDPTTSSAAFPQNHLNLVSALQTSAQIMRVRKSEFVPSTHYFIRVKNQDFNFSNNPSFIYQSNTDGFSKGDIISSLSQNPTTYITTIGLYTDLNELVAVAKLSQPAKKDFSTEALFRIRLDF